MAVGELTGILIQTLIAEKFGFFSLHDYLEKLVAGDDRIGYKINSSPQK